MFAFDTHLWGSDSEVRWQQLGQLEGSLLMGKTKVSHRCYSIPPQKKNPGWKPTMKTEDIYIYCVFTMFFSFSLTIMLWLKNGWNWKVTTLWEIHPLKRGWRTRLKNGPKKQRDTVLNMLALECPKVQKNLQDFACITRYLLSYLFFWRGCLI